MDIIEIDILLKNRLDDIKFKLYYDYLIERNQHINLTNITSFEDVYEKHFYDSVFISTVIDLQDKTLLDIGAGAGFPSIPNRIIENSLKVTIVDGLSKRINFLKELCEILDISNVSLIHGRAEELSKKEAFDIVTARAVAKLNVLSEIALPFVKKNGYFAAFKSINFESELQEANRAISILGGEVEKVFLYKINEEIIHSLILIKKIKSTPNIYPRAFAKIKKTPL